jgi:MYXO-CTERM domain-containing protein
VQRLLANGQPDSEFGGDGIIEIPDLAIFCSDGVLVFGPRADGGVIVGNEQTIVAVDAAGNIDPTFGVNGHLDVSELDPNGNLLMPDGGLLTPDGGLLFFRSGTLTGLGDTVFWKFDRNGQLDLDFGGGTGSVTADLGAAFQEEPSSREYIGQLALDPDGEHVVAQMSLSTGSSNYTQRRILCSGIVRLSIDGSLDDGFGRNGLTCLNITFGLIAVQSDGAPLFFADNSIHRLLPDNSPSPGFLSVASSINSFTRLSESGTATETTVVRVAGRDGAVGVNYATVVRPGLGYPATAGSDYTATSGRLDWADGDDSPRTVTVSILEDTIDEPSEIFGVEISEPSGGVQLIGAIMTAVISDDDEASTTPPPPPGGGGSASWATALALLGLLLIRRRDFWQRAACLRLHEK